MSEEASDPSTVQRIHYRQTGGLAGLTRVADVALGELDADAAADLSRLARAAVAEPPLGDAPASRAVPDGQQYEITVESVAGTSVVRGTDPLADDAFAALVGVLRAARRARPTVGLSAAEARGRPGQPLCSDVQGWPWQVSTNVPSTRRNWDFCAWPFGSRRGSSWESSPIRGGVFVSGASAMPESQITSAEPR